MAGEASNDLSVDGSIEEKRTEIGPLFSQLLMIRYQFPRLLLTMAL